MTFLKLQETSSIRDIARKFDVIESTLRRRYNDQIVFFSQTRQFIHNRLSSSQEQALISQINQLTDKDISFTIEMIRNFVEKVVKNFVNKN